MCPDKVSLNIKFEGSSWKIDFTNAKNAKVMTSHYVHI